MQKFFDELTIKPSSCLDVMARWLSNDIDAVQQQVMLGKLDVSGVREALDTAFSKYQSRARELGVMMGFEHEFVRYATDHKPYQAMHTKAGDLMRHVVTQAKVVSQSTIESQAGQWLSR